MESLHDPEGRTRRILEANALDSDDFLSRADLLVPVPESLRSCKRKPLPQQAVELVQEYYDAVRFLDLIAAGASTPEAGVAIRKKERSAYYFKEDIDRAGSPTRLFQCKAIELVQRGPIWGHQTEPSEWARLFFLRLVGGPEEGNALRKMCKDEKHTLVSIRHYQQAGDVARVQFLLFLGRELWSRGRGGINL
jgi:hypothetical protein